MYRAGNGHHDHRQEGKYCNRNVEIEDALRHAEIGIGRHIEESEVQRGRHQYGAGDDQHVAKVVFRPRHG